MNYIIKYFLDKYRKLEKLKIFTWLLGYKNLYIISHKRTFIYRFKNDKIHVDKVLESQHVQIISYQSTKFLNVTVVDKIPTKNYYKTPSML